MRGKSFNLAVIYKCFDSFSSLYGPHKINGNLGCENLLRIRLFSSVDGSNARNGQFRRGGRDDYKGGRSDYDSYDDDKFNRKRGGNFGGQKSFDGPGRPMRGERQRGQYGGQNEYKDRDNRRQGRRNEGYSKPFGGGGGGGRGDMKLNDDFFNFEGKDDGLGGDHEGKKDHQPSVSELLSRPKKGEQGGGKEGGNFLDKFKLGDVGEEEESRSGEVDSSPVEQEDKMEAPEEADEIFKQMKQSGLIPNAVAMLDGLCQDGLVQEAMKLFGLMREKGAMPEVVVYTAVVEGFCKAQKLDDAKRIFKKMQNNGIAPNAFSYSVLIKGLCKGKRLEDAASFCEEMLEAGHSPNVPTFTGLVHEVCKETGVEEAQKIIVTLKQKGFFLDEKAVRVYLDKTGPTSPMVWEAIFGPKKATDRAT